VVTPESSDAGSMTPAVVVLVLGAVLTVSLAIEVGAFIASTRNAAYVADVAAEAGASAIDESTLALGEMQLDVDLAAEVANQIGLDIAGSTTRVLDITTGPVEICVEVRQTFHPTILPLPSVPIVAGACASPAAG